MGRGLRIGLPLLLLALGARLFALSYAAHARWQVTLAQGDPSGAELHELDFDLQTPPAVLLSALGCFLAGRWWRR